MGDLGVIFDMDGVLVDSFRAHYESWRRAAASRGLGMTEADFAATFGRTSRAIIETLWGGRVGAGEIERFDAEKEALYREILRSYFPAMEGAGDLIESLAAAGFRLAIGSSGPPENVRCVVECLPQSRHLTALVTGMDISRGKPDPEVFLKAAAKLGLPPSSCAVIEDAPAGIEAARRAGAAAIALLGTASRQELAARGAHLVVGSLRDLSPVIIADLIRVIREGGDPEASLR